MVPAIQAVMGGIETHFDALDARFDVLAATINQSSFSQPAVVIVGVAFISGVGQSAAALEGRER